MIILDILEMKDMLDLQAKTEPLGFILTLVRHEFLCAYLAELLLGGLPNLGTLLRGIDYPFELVHVFHPGDRQVGEVRPLEIIVDGSDLWRSWIVRP